MNDDDGAPVRPSRSPSIQSHGFRAAVPSPPAHLDVEGRIRWLAARQSDVVTRRQLLAAGASRHEIDGRLRRGVLRAVHRGVFAVRASPLDERGRLMAAVLAHPAGAVVSHRSAAVLWGALPPNREAVHVTVAGAPLRAPGIVAHRSRSAVLATEHRVRDGLPCTSLPRTLVDLASVAGPTAAERAWTTLASRRALAPRQVAAELSAHPGRPGSPVVRRLLDSHVDLGVGRSRTDLERAAARMCTEHGLPPPRRNHLVEVRGRPLEVDLVWPDLRVAVELDAWSSHGYVEAFRDDRRRDLDLAVAGWRTVRLLWSDVTTDAASTAARLRTLLGHATA